MAENLRALYVCYFGVREPLVQTQVLPYLRQLTRTGVRMSLLTFEPDLNARWNESSIGEWKERLGQDHIDWHLLPYHRRPTLPATLYDIVRGTWRASALARRDRIDIVHGRSHVGAAIAVLAGRFSGARAIFDIRGFLAEEYVDSGHWKSGGHLARLVKMAERWLCRSADGFVVLTNRARETLFPESSAPGKPLAVIPCCVDLTQFSRVASCDRDAVRRELGVADRVVFVHAGSIDGAYLARETAAFVAAARELEPRVVLLALTQSHTARLIEELERVGVTADHYRFVSVPPEAMPRYLGAADAGLAIARPGFARRAMSPTKVSEYLAAGLPIVATAGVGDLDTFVEQARVGTLLRAFDRPALIAAFEAIRALWRDSNLADRCQHEARSRFDLSTIGGERYRRLYDEIGERPLRVLALASYPAEGASSRFRIVQYVEPLAARRIHVDFSPFLNRALFAALYSPARLIRQLPRLAVATVGRLGDAARAIRADAVFVQRDAMLFGPPVVEWLAARVLRRPLVLDLDDPTYLAEDSPVYGRFGKLVKWPGKTDRLIRWSRVVTCGNPSIAAYVRSHDRTADVVPTVVDTQRYRPACSNRQVPVVGWIGTHSTYPYLQRLFTVFERLAKTRQFTLTLVGSGRTDIDVPGVAVDRRPWSMDREIEDFQSIDVGVYPLVDDQWSAAKSGLKAVQYMACGVPFVMSPVGICAEMGVAGETHFMATTDEEWVAALSRLIDDQTCRRAVGHAGRLFAEQHYSIEEQANRLASIIRAAV